MRILHYYSDTDKMTAEYVDTLANAMNGMKDSCGLDFENVKATSIIQLKKLINEKPADIMNIHGCWHNSDAIAARIATKNGIRIVITPHGQLEPWIIKQNYWKSKLPRIITYQRNIIKRAYAVIVMGRMETGCVQRLKWNQRTETVLNSLITEAITANEMAAQTAAIYNKVMDSNVYELLDDDIQFAFASLIKAGISGDQRWLTDEEYNSCKDINIVNWRRILIYAHHTMLSETILNGAQVINVPVPDIRPAAISCYLPQTKEGQKTTEQRMKKSSSDSDTTAFIEWIKALHKQFRWSRITISDVVNTAVKLRKMDADEKEIMETLDDKRLGKFVSSLMQVMRDFTRLEEGFMIAKPKKNRRTKRIESMIIRQLEI